MYHRRPPGETDANNRVICIDKMSFDANGLIEPVKVTTEGVARRLIETNDKLFSVRPTS